MLYLMIYGFTLNVKKKENEKQVLNDDSFHQLDGYFECSNSIKKQRLD